MSDQVPIQLTQKIQPPSAERIAYEAGPVIYEQYLDSGLLCFRTELPPTQSGQVLVEEGYMLPTVLPNGVQLHERVVTKTITKEEAIHVR